MGKTRPPEGLEDEEGWRDDFPRRLLDALQFSCNVLFQVFLTLKLDKTVPWDWCVVTVTVPLRLRFHAVVVGVLLLYVCCGFAFESICVCSVGCAVSVFGW